MAKLLTGSDLAKAQFERYRYLNDTHHRSFMQKARKCDGMFSGDDHWDHDVKQALLAQNRPALTINMVHATIQAMTGEQITNRSEISYKPKANGATDEVALALTKVSRHIDDDNDYEFIETDVFEDGVITSRGFFDYRVEFDDHLQGEIKIAKENPNNIILDGDADSYDPADWRDVTKTVWMSMEDIENLYSGNAVKRLGAKRIDAGLEDSFGIDSINRQTISRVSGYWGGFPSSIDTDNAFGRNNQGMLLDDPMLRMIPTIRVLERQYKLYTDVESFYFPETGDLRVIPATWDEERIREFVNTVNQEMGRIETVSERKQRIRWTVSADDEILFDNWSPYRSFTIVPYFPHFRYGRTIGAVENIIDAQELLNKTLSQELHVINTTANSGWSVEQDSLVGMEKDELEQSGAKTGLVIEYRKGSTPPEKIQPNQIPSGLERVSAKGAQFIRDISTITKTALGQDREDVAARAIEAKSQRTSVNLSRIMDNLDRTRKIGARKKLELIQQFYTEPRIIQIAGRSATRPEQEVITINEQTPEGTVANDLTLGEYNAVITSVPARDSLEDSQFEEAVKMKELGLEIPDEAIVEVSRLPNRAELVKEMVAAKENPLVKRQQEAEILETEAKAQLRGAETQKTLAEAEAKKFEAAKNLAQLKDPESTPEMRKLRLEAAIKKRDHAHELAMRELETRFNIQSSAERDAQQLEIMKQNAAAQKKDKGDK